MNPRFVFKMSRKSDH